MNVINRRFLHNNSLLCQTSVELPIKAADCRSVIAQAATTERFTAQWMSKLPSIQKNIIYNLKLWRYGLGPPSENVCLTIIWIYVPKNQLLGKLNNSSSISSHFCHIAFLLKPERVNANKRSTYAVQTGEKWTDYTDSKQTELLWVAVCSIISCSFICIHRLCAAVSSEIFFFITNDVL